MQRYFFTFSAVFVFVLAAAVTPASAQVDLSGIWAPLFHEDQPERVPGPEVGDYAGLPITDAERLRGESWDASLLTLPEHQCKPHPSTYGFRGVGNLRISNIIDEETQQLTKIFTHIQWQEQEREIWMDDRPSPPDFAAHTWQGFSKGHWEGNTLVVETDHLKAGWIRRNGLALTDKAHMTERFIRHGNLLTHVYIIEDPYYLTEPWVQTTNYRWAPNTQMEIFPCTVIDEGLANRQVPHFLPGANPYLLEFAKENGTPPEAAKGGSDTMYPDYRQKLKKSSNE